MLAPIVNNRSCIATTSKLNKLAYNSFLVQPCFDEKEDNAPLHQNVEGNRDVLTSDAIGRGQRFMVNAEKRTLLGKSKSTAATSNKNKLTKKSIHLPPDFYSMEDNDNLNLEAEVTPVAQRSNRLQKSTIGFENAKYVAEISLNAQRSLFESKKEKKVVEMAQDAKRSETREV